MKKTIYLWLWLFILPVAFCAVKAQTVLASLEKLDLSTLAKGESLECYIVYKTQTDGNWLALDHGATSVKQGTAGTSNERLYVGFTSLSEENRYDMKYCWKVTKYDDSRYVIEWSTPVQYASTGYQYVDENGLLRSDGHSDWMRYYLCYMGIGGEVNTGAVNTSEPITFGHPNPKNKVCWKYDEANKRMSAKEEAVIASCNHARDFYFLKYEFTSTSEADIAAYQLAYDNALISKNELLAIDNNLDNLKATNTSDWGKFDASKIEILQGLGSVYTRDQYTTADDRATVVAAATTLQSVVNLKSAFYRTSIVPTQGWYRLKSKENNAYLNSDATFAGTELKYDGSQYCYLISNSDVNTRFMFYTFNGLKVGDKTMIGAYGNGGHFQLYDCGTKGIYMKSGGGNSEKWTGIKPDNTITSETNTPDYLDNLLLFDLIPVSEEEIRVASIVDGEYSLSFDGTFKDGTYTVKDGKITVNDVAYRLVSYNGINYSIGDDKVATLDKGLVPTSYRVNKTNPNNAPPFPGFRLTPVVEPTADEISVSSLTNFAAGDLSGKKVKVTGTVDFRNLEDAGATDLSLIDNQPFYAYDAITLSNTLKYTRAFNPAATGAYSTKEAPKWQTICLPFDVEKVDAYCPVTYTGGDASTNWTAGIREDLSPAADYWLYELKATGFERSTTGIKANVPYIIAFPYSWINGGETGSYAPKLNISGDVTFSGKAVSATENVLNEGAEFNMANNFANVAAGEDVYVLDVNGEYFEKSVASANPFRPYAVLPSAGTGEAPSRLFLFEGGSSPTGLSEISSMKAKVNVLSVPGGVNVISEEAHVVTICGVNGAELGRVRVSEGTQMITLPVGVFVIDGIKVVVNE